jgi:hypothetical protein
LLRAGCFVDPVSSFIRPSTDQQQVLSFHF